MKLFLFFFFYLLQNINTFMFGVQKLQREYCFSKEINIDEQTITFNFATIGEKKQYVDVVLRQLIPKRKDIYSTSKSLTGEFKTNPLTPGKYHLCFYPYSTDTFSISFNFQTSEEDGDIKNIATDTQLKGIQAKIEDIKKGMRTIENNENTLLSTKFSHFLYLTDYISQIKNLTFIKICIIGSISLFQIFVIQKMFGADKRMTQIKTNTNANSKINNKIEFL